MNHSELVSLFWAAKEILRGKYKAHEYGNVILPFVVLRRLGRVLEPTKSQAISEFNSKVWNEKMEIGLHLPDSIKIEIPKELEIFKKDLVAMHHLE